MTLVLNLLPLFIIAIGAVFVWKLKAIKSKVLAVGITIAALFLLGQAQPSYLPKGEIKRSAIPTHKVDDSLVIQDRNSKPMTPAERDERMTQKYKDGLDFIEKK